MNLHAAVRGVIPAVNPDQDVVWRRSTGQSIDSAGQQTPTYAADVTVRAQVQAESGGRLSHTDKLNLSGTLRSVYLFGDVQGVVRPDAKGGDLLVFPQVLGGQDYVWLVVAVPETWTPDGAGWCRVTVQLQRAAP